MNWFQSKKAIRGVPDLLMYDSLVANGVLMLQDGALLSAWRYRGPDMASRTVNDLEALSARVNSALKLGSGWMVHVDAIRSEAPGYPEQGHFPDPVTYAIDEERRGQSNAEGVHFESDYFITLTFLPPSKKEGRATELMFNTGGKRRTDLGAVRVLSQFEEKATAFGDRLSQVVHAQRLEASEDGQFDDLLRYVRRCVSGEDYPFASLEYPTCLQDVIGCVDMVGGIEPQLAGMHMRCLAIDGFPRFTRPGVLEVLDGMPFAYRWNTRAILLDTQSALSILEVTFKKWNSKIRGWVSEVTGKEPKRLNRDAQKMAEDANQAIEEANAGDIQYVLYSSNIVLLDRSEDRLDEHVRLVRKAIQNAGFSCRIETVNCVEAWVGSLPGDGYRNLRRYLPHTLNVADMLPLASIWAGSFKNPCRIMQRVGATDPLLMAATTGATPFRFNLHVGDNGHTLMTGPPDAGKSTALALIVAQWFRYADARVVVFDKGFSMRALCEATGHGQFYDLAADKSLAFCPLQQISDSPREAAWAVEWLESLILLQGGSVGPAERGELSDAVQLLRDSDSKTLTDLSTNLQDLKLRQALTPYTLAGNQLGPLLDAERDSVRDGRFSVFEMSGLMDMGKAAVSAVLPYLFHRIQRSLEDGNGEPTLIILDEAWVFLENPLFERRIREWLKTIRKLNASVIIATQNLADIFNSPIRSVILENCLTKILLPNAEASNPESRTYYESLGLNSREIDIIKTAVPHQDYYVASPDGRRKIQLGLGKVALSFVGVSGQDQRRAIEAVMAQHGSMWPVEWLRSRGLPEWAQFVRAQMAKVPSRMAGD